MKRNKDSFVSIIIPIYNNSEQLETCLNVLEHQTYPQELYEIIVIDNNSEEDIAAVVNQFGQAHLAYESCRGSYAARNKGLFVAKGDFIGFSDSDCIPASDWIEKGVENLLRHPECGLVAGKIQLFFKNPGKPTVVELYDSMNFLRQEHYVEQLNFGATANLFTRKEVFEKAGLFDANLKSSGDREWGQRVHRLGYSQIYAEDVLIAHPARDKLRDLQKKVSRIFEGLYVLDSEKLPPFTRFIYEAYLDIKPPRKEILSLLNNERLNSLSLKTKYVLLFMFLRWTVARSKIKIYIARSFYQGKFYRKDNLKLASND